MQAEIRISGTLSTVEAVYQGDIAKVRSLLATGTDVNMRCGEGWPLLHYAVMGNHPEIVRLLLEAGADVNGKSKDGATALINASQAGQYETVKTLLEYSASLNHLDKDGHSALKLAADNGDIRTIELIQAAVAKRWMKLTGQYIRYSGASATPNY
jgi:ankyrin repeat protein